MNVSPRKQEGVMLLEALIGILIFSLGVLALVAMQAVSVSTVSNARYRTEASFLANEILSQVWVDRGVNYNNVASYAVTGGVGASTPAQNWVDKVNALMPSSTTYPPTVAIDTPAAGGRQVTVTIRWKAPEAADVSNHTAVAFISDP
jgi:type IV pilus assembly protein PilV